jgi:hypothetical protein
MPVQGSRQAAHVGAVQFVLQGVRPASPDGEVEAVPRVQEAEAGPTSEVSRLPAVQSAVYVGADVYRDQEVLQGHRVPQEGTGGSRMTFERAIWALAIGLLVGMASLIYFTGFFGG